MQFYESFINKSIALDLILSQHQHPLRILAIKIPITPCNKTHIKYYMNIYQEVKKFSMGVRECPLKGVPFDLGIIWWMGICPVEKCRQKGSVGWHDPFLNEWECHLSKGIKEHETKYETTGLVSKIIFIQLWNALCARLRNLKMIW